jgi:hypothetical protein
MVGAVGEALVRLEQTDQELLVALVVLELLHLFLALLLLTQAVVEAVEIILELLRPVVRVGVATDHRLWVAMALPEQLTQAVALGGLTTLQDNRAAPASSSSDTPTALRLLHQPQAPHRFTKQAVSGYTGSLVLVRLHSEVSHGTFRSIR